MARVAVFKTHSMTQRAYYSSLRGKVIAVSGAASGMGLATAKLLYPMGVKLSLADINRDALDKAVTDLKASASPSTGDIITVGADLSSSSEATAWIQTTVEKYGALNGAANFAGILGSMVSLVETSDEEWLRIQSVNLFGTFFALKAQLKAMLERGDKGSIVNMSSLAGIRGGYGPAAYSVSKHGVAGLTKSAAKEVGHLGIRVNAIAAGAIDTPMSRAVPPVMLKRLALAQAATPLGRQGRPEEAAKLTAFLLSDESSYTTGEVHVLDGGLSA